MRRLGFVIWLSCALVAATLPPASHAQILTITLMPPELPVYEQPPIPDPGYIWTPGYWAYGPDGYYWVPGTWVQPPTVGLLWTPGYWGWNDGVYAWNAGYWGPQIGFYGGINYGFGYGGVGFGGGKWRGGAFFYNTAVMRVNTTQITNVYVNKTVIVNNESHVAFNGGEGGVAARPTPAEVAAAREPHQAALAAQTEHEHAASQNRAMFASENHGAPAVAATARPGEFSGHGVVAARAAGALYHAPAISPREARASAFEANRANAANRPFTPPPHTESAPRAGTAHPQNESHPENSSKAKP